MGKGMGTVVRKGMGIGKLEGGEGRRERWNRKWTGRDGDGKGREDGTVGTKRQEARNHKASHIANGIGIHNEGRQQQNHTTTLALQTCPIRVPSTKQPAARTQLVMAYP